MKNIKLFLVVAVTLLAVGSVLNEALLMYQNDTLRNNPSILESLEEEAKQGTPNAAFLLATAYRNGKTGVVDIDKSFYWYQKSAKMGDSDAMLMLGWLYYKKTNIKKARYWFTQAASNGIDEAVEMLELLSQ